MDKIQVKNFKFGLSCGIKTLNPFDCFHRHNEIELTFFDKVPVLYRVGNVITKLGENESILFWGAIPHQLVETEPNNTAFYIHVPLEIFFQWQLPEEIFQRLLNGEVFKEISPASRIMDENSFPFWINDITHESSYIRKSVLLNIESRILRFIANSTSAFKFMKSSISRTVDSDKSTFTRLYEYLLKAYRTKKTLGEIAADLGIHPNYASELFKSNTGINIVDFVNMLKVAEAQRLLLTTKMKVVDIAYDAGFGSLSHFNMVFKNYCDISPRKYRARIFSE